MLNVGKNVVMLRWCVVAVQQTWWAPVLWQLQTWILYRSYSKCSYNFGFSYCPKILQGKPIGNCNLDLKWKSKLETNTEETTYNYDFFWNDRWPCPSFSLFQQQFWSLDPSSVFLPKLTPSFVDNPTSYFISQGCNPAKYKR
jgi:hypothetical protein